VLSGRVLDVGGGGIADAQVTATLSTREQLAAPLLFQAVSKADGRFRIVARKGEYMLNARASGYAPGFTALAVGGDTTYDLVLQPAARISGRVVERGSDKPVGGARVALVPSTMGRGLGFRDVTADADGRFSFDDVSAGVYQIHATHEALEGVSSAVAVGIADTATDVVVPVSRARIVSGRVVGPDGKPVPDVLVSLYRREPPWSAGVRGKSDASGAFELKGVFAGTWFAHAQSDDHPSAMSEPIKVGDVDVTNLELKLASAGVVDGQVVDASGRPVANALVTADVMPEKPNRAYSPVSARRTDADGRFVLKPVSAGRLTLSAQHDSAGIVRLPSQPIAEAEHKTIAVKLQPSGSIHGIVRFDDGTPAASVTVTANNRTRYIMTGPPPTATSGRDGRFALTTLEPGDYELYAAKPNRPRFGVDRSEPARVAVAVGETKRDVELRVKKGGKTISGIVVGGGKPVANAVVAYERDVEGRVRAFRYRGEQPTALTDADGRFTIADVEDGTYVVSAEHPSFAEGEVAGVGAGATNVKLELPAPASIAGTLVTTAGTPVAQATVTVVPPSADEREKRARMTTGAFGNDLSTYRIDDPSGAFELGRLAPGTYDVKATTPDGSAAAQTVTVAAGEKKTGVRLVVEAGVKLVGRVVTLGSGEPIGDANVMAMSPGRSVQGKSGADGRFELTGVVPGETISLVTSGGQDFVGERIDVDVPKGRDNVDVGTIPLLKGSWEERAKSGDNRGVGVQLAWKQGRLAVVSAFPGTPAEKAGIKPGDAITAIDGKPLGEARAGAAQWLIGGRVGTPITLTLEGGRTVTMTREDGKPAADKKATITASGAADRK
jgi:uncharacterized GH25 family protein